ncbi:hypothetical protein F5Y09DRAFT_297518 [Xylaria sp. FL1042]|nr:hypothetical protein F5Y09DRAFT_297518 [Xylaria sp. FL1042]
MSQKITSKNLTYDTALPPFLARLHGQQTARSGPDLLLAAHRRPGQKRSASEEAEDAPVVVDEDGNVITRFPVGSDDKVEATAQDPELQEDSPQTQEARAGHLAHSKEEKVASIGVSRKRKAGRVVGEGRSSDDERGNTKAGRKSKSKDKDDDARIAKASADVRRLIRRSEDTSARSSGAPTNGSDDRTIKSGKKKKPAKKIKLSFGDDDDDE